MEVSTAPRYASQSESEHHPLPLIARPKEPAVHQRRHKAAPPAPRLFTPGLALTCLLAGSLSAAAVMAGDWETVVLEAWQTAPTGPGALTPAAPPSPARPAPAEQALYLVRATLTALDQANRTGNYAVLRDLASPAFQARNSAADLANGFAGLRGGRVDLSAATLVVPQLTRALVSEGGASMLLAGSYHLQPQVIDFDLRFVIAGGHWRLDAIAVGARPAASAQHPGTPPPAQRISQR